MVLWVSPSSDLLPPLEDEWTAPLPRGRLRHPTPGTVAVGLAWLLSLQRCRAATPTPTFTRMTASPRPTRGQAISPAARYGGRFANRKALLVNRSNLYRGPRAI